MISIRCVKLLKTDPMKNQIGYTIFFVSVMVSCWAIRTSLDGDVVAEERVATSVADLAMPLIQSEEAAGLSIGIVSLDAAGKWVTETQHFGNSGSSNTSSNASLPTDETLYEIGGLANVLTGTLLAIAVERGEVSLDTPAADLMPENVTMPELGDRKITLADMVTHRSGLPRLADNMPMSNPNDPYHDYTSKLAGEFLNRYKLTRTPGSRYEYSNVGMAYLGHLLTLKAGAATYDTMLSERLVGPLGMTATAAQLAETNSKIAVGHTAAGTEAIPWNNADMPGAGGIRSTIADLNRLMLANLKSPDDTTGKAIDLAFRKHVDPTSGEFAMGLGWLIARDGSTRFHNGRTGGFSAAMFVNRELNLGICVLSNTASQEITDLAGKLIRMKAGIKVTVPSSDNYAKMNGEPVDRFVGRYQLTPQFIFDVRRDGDKLMVGITNQSTQRVYPRDENEWHYKGIEASLLFGDFKNGKANSVTLIQNGLRQKASRIGDRDGEGYPKASPFSAIRWRDAIAEVQVEETWYELVSLDDHSAGEILKFSRQTFGRSSKKRFEEDLVELLSRMGHAPQSEVKLVLKSLDSGKTTVLDNVAMTAENRNAILAAGIEDAQ